MKTIAIATSADFADLYAGDLLAVAALDQLGVSAIPAVWDDPNVAWDVFDAVIIRSCWDYHVKTEPFLTWVDRLETAGLTVWNPPALVRWNMHKGYLLELEEAGVPIIPTALVPAGEAPQLAAVMEQRGWAGAVVKPAISLGGFDTWVVRREATADDQMRFAELVRSRDVLVQLFAEEILSAGELSLVYFEGSLSHSVVKLPKTGEFRVQDEYGGSTERITPSLSLVAAAERVLSQLTMPYAFARVDGVLMGGEFRLMELELIDPSLYLRKDEESPARFARSLAALLDQ